MTPTLHDTIDDLHKTVRRQRHEIIELRREVNRLGGNSAVAPISLSSGLHSVTSEDWEEAVNQVVPLLGIRDRAANIAKKRIANEPHSDHTASRIVDLEGAQ